jgi:uncharacterized protein (DUF1015 family)
MSVLRPFRGIRPDNSLAGEIIAPPYDVLSRAEAREICSASPQTFLHATRPDGDLPDDVDAHAPEIYAGGHAALNNFLARGWLQRDENPCFYLYTQSWLGQSQVGLMATCAVEEYDAGQIKKHELTRPDKEQDRVDHIEALDAQTGLVFLTYRDRPEVAAVMAAAADRPTAWEVTTEDDVTHRLQVIDDDATIAAVTAAFSAHVEALYVADGHHRSAAASRVAATRKHAGTSGRFLAGIFPDTQLRVLAYNRVVADLNGHTPASFMAALQERFTVEATETPAPARRGCFTMYLEGSWHRLAPRLGVVPTDDPVGSLDASILQDNVLSPLLGITDPRRDTRISFVGGIRGADALSGPVDQGAAAVAFHLFPTGMDQLLAVADADRLMPPKSTWFEPKLRGGVVIHRIAE